MVSGMGGDTLSAPMFWSVLEGKHHGQGRFMYDL